ncbi:MAG: HAD hydrolase-like protein [Oscillospiraceae bacterium]|nr:HAD hydrolase-like protein [Oscillospiraceae bacterium]
MNYKTVLFDFDGTLFDTLEGITKCVQYALGKHGIPSELEALRCFAGPPLAEKFMEVYGVDRELAQTLLLDYRERYAPIGIYESRPFPAVDGMLRRLREAGLQLGVATSKPQDMAEHLLNRAGMLRCFDAVVGSTPGRNDDQKWVVLRRCMEQCGAEPDSTVLVGDTKYDAIGAARCGIPCIGVAWGYAAPGELEAAGVARIVPSCAALEALLLADGTAH